MTMKRKSSTTTPPAPQGVDVADWQPPLTTAALLELKLDSATLLEMVKRSADQLTNARATRNAAMEAARAGGVTWRAIAQAAGMTEHGVRKAIDGGGDE